MTTITFQPIMDGIKRKLTINKNVKGYKHTTNAYLHFFTRGKIQYILNAYNEHVTIEKFNVENRKSLPITYKEIEKFIHIEKDDEPKFCGYFEPDEHGGICHYGEDIPNFKSDGHICPWCPVLFDRNNKLYDMAATHRRLKFWEPETNGKETL